jgi:hypothetical protein
MGSSDQAYTPEEEGASLRHFAFEMLDKAAEREATIAWYNVLFFCRQSPKRAFAITSADDR